jgi:hypothetical protein
VHRFLGHVLGKVLDVDVVRDLSEVSFVSWLEHKCLHYLFMCKSHDSIPGSLLVDELDETIPF